MVVHLTACFWNLLGEVELRDSWLDVEISRYNPTMSKYIQCIYFSLTVLLTVGYGNYSANNTIERVILIIWMFFGVVMYAYIINTVSGVFRRMNKHKTSKNEREHFYSSFGRIFKLPEQVLDQVLATVGLHGSSNNTGWVQIYEANKILLNELPKSLYGDICTHVYRELVEAIDFFHNKPKHFLVRILPLLKPYNLSYLEEVYKLGDPPNEVFFIHKGRAASICFDRLGKMRSLIFVQGSYFGECDIIYKRARTSTAFAESNATIWKLNKSEFLSILEDFPEVQKEIMALARIKDMYRAPVMPVRQSKFKEIIYAKVLTKSRSMRFDDTSESFDSQVSKKTASFSLSPVQGNKNANKAVAVSLINLGKPDDLGVENEKNSWKLIKPKLNIDDSAAFKLKVPQEGVMKKNISLRQTLQSPERQKVFFPDEPSNMQGVPSMESIIIKDSPPIRVTNSSFFLEEQKSQRMGHPSPDRLKHSARNDNEKINAKMIEILNSRDCFIDNVGILEIMMGGKDTVLEYEKQFEITSDKTALEIEQFVDSESRIDHSVNAYQEYLTQLVQSNF